MSGSETHQPMASYRRNFIPGGTYFFTVNLAERRQHLFTDHIEGLRAAFRYARTRHPFTIEAIVVLPDHLHAIWTLPEGERDFALRWRLIKAAFSRSLPRNEWVSASRSRKGERGYGSAAIASTRSEWRDFARHADYILFTRSSTATSRRSGWPYSSFHRMVRLGFCPRIGRRFNRTQEAGFGER